MENARTNDAANVRTDTPDEVKFTEGERAIMLAINHLSVAVDRLTVKVEVLMGKFDRKADCLYDLARSMSKKGGAK